MAISLFPSSVLYDLEPATVHSVALSLMLYSQVHGDWLRRQSGHLAQVFGRCDSDDSPDADNGNGCVVELYSELRSPRAASSAL